MTHTLSLLAAFTLAIFSCETTPSSMAGNFSTSNTSSAGPPNAELLEALRGRWQRVGDAAYVLEIRDDKMSRIYAGQTTEEFELEAFSDCESTPCKADSSFASGGWCFTEKGANGLQCNRVVRCDSILQFDAAGKTDIFRFKKIRP